MRTHESFALGALFGIAIGMLLEHQLFLREMQSISQKHKAAKESEAEAQPA
jgi:hypothetical protein